MNERMNRGNEFISVSVRYLQITCDIIVLPPGQGRERVGRDARRVTDAAVWLI